jgi:hypothetical protein
MHIEYDERYQPHTANVRARLANWESQSAMTRVLGAADSLHQGCANRDCRLHGLTVRIEVAALRLSPPLPGLSPATPAFSTYPHAFFTTSSILDYSSFHFLDSKFNQ